jgi:arylsulfatase A-like enzyme
VRSRRPPPRLRSASLRALGALAAAVASATAGPSFAASPPAARPPHVVILLADDLGWNDVGYHGSEIPTPSIDALARDGVRLERFYAWTSCSPTRAALLTGRYPVRMGLQAGVVMPWADWGLPEAERTLPEALAEAGYRSLLVGKWHLGHARASQLPRARGFAHHYGSYLGAIDHFTHRRDGGLDWHRNGRPVEEPGYATFLLANEAMRLLRAHDPAQPLFLLVSFTAPHAPLQAPPHYVARHADTRDPDRRRYAGMVTALDEAVGRIRAVLRERGMEDDTLVLFASDNGGLDTYGGSNLPLRGGKTGPYEGGVRVPAVAAWPGRWPAGTVVDAPLHVVDWYPTLLALAGARLEQPRPVDGRDLSDVLAGAPATERELLLDLVGRRGAIRAGPWKLVRGRDGLELFDLDADPTESHDLAAVRPDRARALAARLDVWAARAAPPLWDPSQERGFEPPAVWGPPAPDEPGSTASDERP